MYKYPYPMASLTSDCVIWSKKDDDVYFLGIIRKDDPFKDKIALPGGFINVLEETSEQAARRELLEETGLNIKDLSFNSMYEEINRDPRGRVISFAYVGMIDHELINIVKAGDDAKAVNWYKFEDVLDNKVKLAFDHEKILLDAYFMDISQK